MVTHCYIRLLYLRIIHLILQAASGPSIICDFVTSCLHFQGTGDQDAGTEQVFEMLRSFVRNASVADLKNFLKFVTGMPTVSMATLPHRISVSCHDSNSIFASTCLLELKLPKRFNSYAAFDVAMKSVIEGSTFTSTCLLELKLPKSFNSYAAFDVAMKSVIEGSTFTSG